MSYSVDIQLDLPELTALPVEAPRLQLAAETVLKGETVEPGCALTVVITTDEAVAELNARFRGVDGPTDVLSFPSGASDGGLFDEPPYLGDVVIALPYARRQAQREGHDLGDSLALLVIHGCLHLTGHDHDTPASRARMWRAQEAALRTLGISPEIVPALESEHDSDQT
jgi:probable rRNA maturation factor